jgi:DNA-binding FadR family transcriptional regulator
MFTPIDQKSVVQAIQEQIRLLIRDGQLEPGSKLPSEKLLMVQLGVSRPTLREALHTMVGEGLLEVRPGRGTYVREPTSATAIHAGVVSLLLMSEDIDEIQEVRKILEPEVAARVAERATEEDLRDIELILDEMAEAVQDGTSLFEIAWAFHRRLPQAAGNAAMAIIVDIIYEMIRMSEQPLYDRYFDPKDELRDHRELLRVLRLRDPKQARAAMKAHLEDVSVHLTAGLAAERQS